LTDLGQWSLDNPLPPDQYAMFAMLPPGEVPDLFLNVSLDGSQQGQLVIISHTWLDESGQATTPEVPCPTNETLLGAPTPCDFRVSIFVYDANTGWANQYDEGVKWTGMRQELRATSFKLADGKRDALILTSVICAASHCPFEINSVLTMKEGKIETAATGQTILGFDGGTVTLSNPVSSATPLDLGLAFSNGRLIQVTGLDPATGEVAVIAAELSTCADGTLARGPNPNTILVNCEPGNNGGYVLDEQTAVEPANVGGINGLQDGLRVAVEFIIGECAELVNCESPTLTPVATKITVLPADTARTYVDSFVNIAFDYPANWVLNSAPGSLAHLQSFSANTEGIPPSATRCDFLIMPDGTLYEQEINNFRETRQTRYSEQQWELAGGFPAMRFHSEEPLGGESAALIAEISGRVVYFMCYGELAPFDGIARTLRPAP